MNSEQLIDKLHDLGLRPRSYSGRGMYGRACVGVSVPHLGGYEFPPGWAHEQLGKGYIVYWRDRAWPAYLSEW